MRTPNVNCIVCNKLMYRRKFEIEKARYFACYEHREIAKKMFSITEKQKQALELGREKGTNHLHGLPKSKESNQRRSKTHIQFWKDNPDKLLERGKKIRGSNHYKWDGGSSKINEAIRLLSENRKWQQQVKKRDKNCQICGSNKELESHHIKPLVDIIEQYKITNIDDARLCNELWNIDNGITLCRKCHYELEGRTYDNNKRETI